MPDYFLFFLISIGCVCIASPILAHWIDKSVEAYRRQKYPEYFKMYDEAYQYCILTATEFGEEVQRVRHQLSKYTEGLRDGECREERFEQVMKVLTKRYMRACAMRNERIELNEKMLKDIDSYAKSHNLKWGEIYA